MCFYIEEFRTKRVAKKPIKAKKDFRLYFYPQLGEIELSSSVYNHLYKTFTIDDVNTIYTTISAPRVFFSYDSKKTIINSGYHSYLTPESEQYILQFDKLVKILKKGVGTQFHPQLRVLIPAGSKFYLNPYSSQIVSDKIEINLVHEIPVFYASRNKVDYIPFAEIIRELLFIMKRKEGGK